MNFFDHLIGHGSIRSLTFHGRAQVVDDDRGASSGEVQGKVSAETAASTGHDGDLVGELNHSDQLQSVLTLAGRIACDLNSVAIRAGGYVWSSGGQVESKPGPSAASGMAFTLSEKWPIPRP
jgi:hypothetical protein